MADGHKRCMSLNKDTGVAKTGFDKILMHTVALDISEQTCQNSVVSIRQTGDDKGEVVAFNSRSCIAQIKVASQACQSSIGLRGSLWATHAGRSGGPQEKQLLLYSGSYLRAQDFDAMRQQDRQMAQAAPTQRARSGLKAAAQRG